MVAQKKCIELNKINAYNPGLAACLNSFFETTINLK